MSEGLQPNRINYGMGKAAAKAYRGIRSRIIDGSFKPGDTLTERLLSKFTGVSRTPVREALRRLSSEGMLVLSANRGAIVSIIDHREIKETFDIISLLGSYSSRIAAANISQAALDELRDLVDQIDSTLLSDDNDFCESFLQFGRSFHMVIRKAAGYQRLINIIRELKISKQTIFHPPVKWAEIPAYIKAADCVIVPSLAEGFGFAAAETCAMDVPLVATNTTSLPEVVSGNTF